MSTSTLPVVTPLVNVLVALPTVPLSLPSSPTRWTSAVSVCSPRATFSNCTVSVRVVWASAGASLAPSQESVVAMPISLSSLVPLSMFTPSRVTLTVKLTRLCPAFFVQASSATS